RARSGRARLRHPRRALRRDDSRRNRHGPSRRPCSRGRRHHRLALRVDPRPRRPLPLDLRPWGQRGPRNRRRERPLRHALLACRRLLLSTVFAVGAGWLGLTLSYRFPTLPPSSMVVGAAVGIYALTLATTAARRGSLSREARSGFDAEGSLGRSEA